jgi:hypothetical protein
MTDWVEFDALIEPLEMGAATYTILRLPADMAAALGDAKRVEGEINDHPVNLALSRTTQVDGVFLWCGRSLLDRLEIDAFEPVTVRLRPAPDDAMDLPEDVAAALLRGGALTAWDALTPGKMRGMLYQIDTAKTAATRAKRIATLIATLTEGPR